MLVSCKEAIAMTSQGTTTLRTVRSTVTFRQSFTLSGMDGPEPAGTYTVETDEELIQELSFPAYRRIATVMFLPSAGSPGTFRIADIDPLELAAAQARDAAGSTGG